MIFLPTGTTEAMITAVKPHITGGKLLDLGCGSGVIGSEFTDICEVYASDLDPDACECVADNPKIRVRCGNLFEPWKDKKFNFIIDDVSGVAEDIAKVSPWFKGVPCESGKDGADLVCKVLWQAPEYLEENGKLFFPIVSLSNVERILETAKCLYDVTLLSHTEFPLPKEMNDHLGLLRELQKEGIQFKEKFGMIIFFTDIYMASL